MYIYNFFFLKLFAQASTLFIYFFLKTFRKSKHIIQSFVRNQDLSHTSNGFLHMERQSLLKKQWYWGLASRWSKLLPSGRTLSTKIEFRFSRPCKRCSDQGPDTPSDGFVSHVLERLISWSFTGYNKLTFFLVWRFLYIVSEARPLSLMMEGFFGSSWCH